MLPKLPRRYRNIIYIIVTVITLLSAFSASQKDELQSKKIEAKGEITNVSAQSTHALVTEVIDGDTIKIDTGETVRYIGIDTPETKHPQKAVECFGEEASKKNAEVVLGMKIRLDTDVSNKDRYGRLLRYVYLGDIFVNDYLVKNGYAHATAFPPDVRYQKLFEQSEKEARSNNMGLWNSALCAADNT